LIFPKKCVACKKIGSFLCDNCFSYLSFENRSICLVCQKPSFDGLTHPRCEKPFSIDGSFSVIPYNKTAQKLIYSFKYNPYLFTLNKILGDLFYEGLIQNEYFMQLIGKYKLVLIPIPLHSSRLRKRGYNQARILADQLGKRFNLEVADVLERARNTKAQFGLDKKQRKENIVGAFILKSSIKNLKSKNIFIVDDLVTTGSTLTEAAKVLKRAGAKKAFGLTLARD
jgi:competence protein ComFC